VRVFSRFCADHMKEHYGLDAEVVPPTVDTEVFRPQGCKDLSRPKILYTADLIQPSKGPHVLAAAFNHIHRARPEAVLQLAGPVGTTAAALDPVLELIEPAARPSVELLGPGALGSLPKLYAAAAVTVLPSLGEPFGMVLTESLACGTPAVGANSGAIPEILTDPAVGTLFERDEDATASAGRLAEAVLRTLDLTADPATAGRCRRHAEQFTWDAVGKRFERLHDLARGVGPGFGIVSTRWA
jgi:phosphatidylinositol alpha-1,6-mannosyltransferase